VPIPTSTIAARLRWRAEHDGSRVAFTVLDGDAADTERRVGYADLDRRARSIAALLRDHARAGDRVLLLQHSGVDYIASFFGCLYAGVVAVPIHPPRSGRPSPRLTHIAADSGARIALTTNAILAGSGSRARRMQDSDLPPLTLLAIDDLPPPPDRPDRYVKLPGEETIAYLQYTSGSTSTPRGVAITHRNIIANERAIEAAFGHSAESVIVSWMPLYHDMGLIGGILQPLFIGAHGILLTPGAFLRRPACWLEAITRWRATTSGGPNFAYDLCVDRVSAEEHARLDLGSWRLAFNGAEPVRPHTLDRFCARFGARGFRREAFYPCYGLAEATLFVSGRHVDPATSNDDDVSKNEEDVSRTIAAADAPNTAANAPSTTADTPSAAPDVNRDRPAVSCGTPAPELSVLIVDPETRRICSPGETGEIWIAGPSVADGYWNQPETTQEQFGATVERASIDGASVDGASGARSSIAGSSVDDVNAPAARYLRTGDLGTYAAGELTIRGRLKDLIIVRGRNIHPEDVEATIERSRATFTGRACAAFAMDVDDRERLVIVQELPRHVREPFEALGDDVQQAVTAEHQVRADRVVFVPTGAIPRTSSGKVRRHACRGEYASGQLHVLAECRWDDAALLPAVRLITLPPAASRGRAPADLARDLEPSLRALIAHIAGERAAHAADRADETIGLDSLGCSILAHHLEQELGVRLPLTSVATDIPITQLATEIAARLADDDGLERSRRAGGALERGQPGERLGSDLRPAPDDLWASAAEPAASASQPASLASQLTASASEPAAPAPQLAASPSQPATPTAQFSASASQSASLASQLTASASQAAGAASGSSYQDVPALAGQRSLWYLAQMNPASAVHHIARAVRLHGRVDTPALRRAWQALVDRHEALRTNVIGSNGEPSQRIHAHQDVDFTIVDAAGWPDARVQEHVDAEAERPFDLAADRLLRVTCFTRADGDCVLLVVVHHIICDMWSLGVMVQELEHLYTLFAASVSAGANTSASTSTGSDVNESLPLPLPLLTARRQYADYVAHQQTLLNGPARAELETYWRDRIDGDLSPLEFPVSKTRPRVPTLTGGAVDVRIDPDLATRLERLAQQSGASLFVVLLTAWHLLLHRYTGRDRVLSGSPSACRTRAGFEEIVGYLVNPIVITADCSGNPSAAELITRVRQSTAGALAHQEYPFAALVDLLRVSRDPSAPPLVQAFFAFQDTTSVDRGRSGALSLPIDGMTTRFAGMGISSWPVRNATALFDLALEIARHGGALAGSLRYNADILDAPAASRIAGHYRQLLEGIAAAPHTRIAELPLLTESERAATLSDWNQPETALPHNICVHDAIRAQAQARPDDIAAVCGTTSITFAQLVSRADALARSLRAHGVAPDTPVGLCVGRSIDLLIGLLAILEAGGAYVPLDPAYPAERRRTILADARAPIIVADAMLAPELEADGRTVLRVDVEQRPPHPNPLPKGEGLYFGGRGLRFGPKYDDDGAVNSGAGRLPRIVSPSNLAYVIYTSGSTGAPKGVMITHRNVINLFEAFDRVLTPSAGSDTMLATTSVSFDISVLEMLWALARGLRVNVIPEAALTAPRRAHGAAPPRPPSMSLFYFASEDNGHRGEAYRLLLEGARFADGHGFEAVWTPERHFHSFGGLFPNPSVVSAALATMTERIALRAGSVVLPLHNPVRVAEEWALVDNLSRGRVGVSFASGWHVDDFALEPSRYSDRKQAMYDGIDAIRQLWRGDAIRARNGGGAEIDITIHPRPVQSELPMWLTAAGAKDTFVQAGARGLGVLTHLLGQTLDTLSENLAAYRDALAAHGYDERAARVTLMLHTFVSDRVRDLRDTVRAPFLRYLRSSLGLVETLVRQMDPSLDPRAMKPGDLDDLLEFAFNRYVDTSALFGTPRGCLPLVERLRDMGVTEVACLIDFGLPTDLALDALHDLDRLRALSIAAHERRRFTLADLAREAPPTIAQFTPALLRMILLNGDNADAVRGLHTLLVGGDSVPAPLIADAAAATDARVVTVYGPTETTVWSTTHDLSGEPPRGETVPIGRPILNTQAYVLDAHLQLVPAGVTGHLYLAGEGLARGYFGRPDLTAARFVPNPWSMRAGDRLYRTGDLARHRADGVIEFLGRNDRQVKIRGFRIELDEIEAALQAHPAVRQAAVVVHQPAAEDRRLAAYVVFEPESARNVAALDAYLRERLPAYMAPATIAAIDALPLTPNGKIDRRALAARGAATPQPRRGRIDPRNDLESAIAAIWRDVLQVETVGIDENFFDLGGHSLLMAKVHNHLTSALNRPELPLIALLEHPTIGSLAAFLSPAVTVDPMAAAVDRAARQTGALRRHHARGASLRTNRRTGDPTNCRTAELPNCRTAEPTN
jgi:natural product biosynthesis luciferase-like monooxygenase protein